MRTATAKEIKETYTADELRALVDLHRQHPEIVQKQEKRMKSVMKQSMEIGQRIGKSLAQ